MDNVEKVKLIELNVYIELEPFLKIFFEIILNRYAINNSFEKIFVKCFKIKNEISFI